MKLRITVADDSAVSLMALVAVLSPEFEVIATASNGQTALEHIQCLQPAVAVLDLNMPGLNGIEIAREVVRQNLPSGVVICSVENDPDLVTAAQEAGALGYVFKPRLNQDLVTAVRSAACGEPFISSPEPAHS